MAGSIRKRGKDTFVLVISKGYDENGKQIRVYKTVHASSRKEAERMLAEMYIEEKNATANVTWTTFGDFVQLFLKRHCKSISVVTQDHYQKLLNLRILPAFAGRRLSSVTTEDILRFVNVLMGENSKLDGSEGALSGETILKYYKLIHQIFHKAVQWGYLTHSPCDRITKDMLPKSDKKHFPILKEEDLRRLVNVIDNAPVTDSTIKNKLFFFICLTCGTRRGEAGALKWGQVDLEGKTLNIDSALKTVDNRTIGIGETKNKNSRRTVFMDDYLRDLFVEHKKRQELWLVEHEVRNPDDFVFFNTKITDTGEVGLFQPNSVYLWLRKLCRKNNIPLICLHSLRAECATLAASGGMPINLVSAMLGHNSLVTTSIYVRDLLETRRQASGIMFKQLDAVRREAEIRKNKISDK